MESHFHTAPDPGQQVRIRHAASESIRRRVAGTGRHETAWIRRHRRVRTGEHRPCRSVWRHLDRNATAEYRPAISFRRIAELRDGKPLFEVRNAVRLANEG